MMNPLFCEKYAARLNELEALYHELAAGKRPGDGAVVAGLLLEAAGDLLRRKSALGVQPGDVVTQLSAITEQSLKSWGDGVQVNELTARLKRAAAQAVESAIPDSPEDGQQMAQWAAQDLQARDRLESALVALEAMARPDAKTLASRIRSSLVPVDRTCRGKAAGTGAGGPDFGGARANERAHPRASDR
jgi:hypothetical protein